MKKALLALFIFSLLFIPSVSGAAYLIRLKNGGSLTTPLYWFEGRQLNFFYAGGVVGIARGEIDRVEKHAAEVSPEVSDNAERPKKKDTPPPVVGVEKLPAAPNTPPEKLNIVEQKRKKDQLTAELNDLLEKRRQAKAINDVDADQRITAELLNISKEIYRITDVAKEKNRGRLPEGWWDQ